MKLADCLPDNYNKDEKSNNVKLLSIVDDSFNELEYTFKMIERYRDVDTAKGKTLDRIGKNVLESRQGRDDEEYRRFIKFKIRSNLSKGDIEIINEAGEVLLGKSFLGVGETWTKARYRNEPAGIFIRAKNLSFSPELIGERKNLDGTWFINGEYFLNGGFETTTDYDPFDSLEQIKKNIKRVVAGGVKVYWEIPQNANFDFGVSIGHKARLKTRNMTIVDLEALQESKLKVKKKVVSSEAPFKLNGEFNLSGALFLDGNRPRIVNQVTIREVRI